MGSASATLWRDRLYRGLCDSRVFLVHGVAWPTANRQPRTANRQPRTVNGEPLRRVKPAIDGQGQAVEHPGGIAEKKTDHARDIFAFGKSA
jgi:hypothetical protein